MVCRGDRASFMPWKRRIILLDGVRVVPLVGG